MGTLGMPYGLQAMLKEGYKHMSGVDEAVLKNIDACKQLSTMIRTSLGPNGMNKIVVNHLDKIFVTSDASVIAQELEVQHPAAKLLAMAAAAQDTEIGDGTSLVLAFAGELLSNAEDLLREGLTTVEISDGYELACNKALEVLDTLILPGSADTDVRNKELVAQRLRACIASKQLGWEDVLCPLLAEACINVCPKNPQNFDLDNVRIAKVSGGSLYDSQVLQGVLFKRDAEGTVKSVTDAKVAVYSQGIDTTSTETKGTVLIKSAEELESYSKSEENKMEEIIKGIADAGIKVVVSGMAIGEMAMHFIEKYGMMAIRIPSKFDLRRFCRATNTTALVKLVAPKADEIGFAKSINVQEIGGTECIIVKQDSAQAQVATIVLRSSTDSMLDNVERALDDGINAYKALCKNAAAVAAGGAAEIEIARQVGDWGKGRTGLDQYAIAKFAESLEVVPRTLAENSGLDAAQVISALYSAHANGQTNSGVDIATGQPKDLSEDNLTDLYTTKWWALRLAARSALTVLRVDNIIMAKQAGGPKARPGGAADED